ncbi:undecaprenyl-phosphate glucose phosphotransferase [Ampullimonas aquatilis]|uniref:undecaprenyl-phosphate glucose phosphotransferase n=1 Tax=Ampullimonas aquatilis TaxID=1341549 RepID=UPI003C773F4E
MDKLSNKSKIQFHQNHSIAGLLRASIEPAVIVLTLFIITLISTGTIRGAELVLGLIVFSLSYPGQLSLAKGMVSDFVAIVGRWALTFILLLLFGWGTNFLPAFDQDVIWRWAICVPFTLYLANFVVVLFMPKLIAMEHRRAIIVGASEVGKKLSEQLAATPYLGIEFLGFFDDRPPERIGIDESKLIGNMSEVATFQNKEHVDAIYIALPMGSTPRIMKLLDDLRDTTASIYFVPDIFVYDLIQARIDNINGLPVVAVCESPFYGINGIVKRLSDIVISALVLLLISPLLLVVAAGVKLSSPGPVFFKQKRYGLDGLEILVWKFRSLKAMEDGKQAFQAVTQKDPRLTPFGSFIRKTSVDELPQLINVLKGEMSIVGPRPHAVMMNEHYRKLIPGYMVRHKVKPGITGWAQVNGYRGGDDLESMKMRIEYDLEYLRNWSLRLDLFIIFRTVGVVMSDKNAY